MLVRDSPVSFLASDVSVGPSEKAELLSLPSGLSLFLLSLCFGLSFYRYITENVFLKIKGNNLLKRAFPVKESGHTTHREVPAGKSRVKAETLSLRLTVSHGPCRVVGCLDCPAHVVTIDLSVVLEASARS